MMGLPMGDDATEYADSTDSEDLRDDQRLQSETLQDLDLMLGHAELNEFRSQMELTQHRDKLMAHYQNVLQSIHEKESLLRYVYEALAKDRAELEATKQEMENLERHGMDPRVLGSSLLARQFLEDQTSSDTARPSSEDWTPSVMPRHSLDNETPSDMPGRWRDSNKRSCGGRRLFDNPARESQVNDSIISEGKHCFHSHVRISGQSQVASGVKTMPELPNMVSFDESSRSIIDSAIDSAFSGIAKCVVAVDDRAKHPVRLGQGSIGAALTMPALPIMNFKLEDSSSGAASGLQDDSKNMRSGVDLDHKSRKVPGHDVPVVQECAERDAAQAVTNHGVISEGKLFFHDLVRISGQSKVASGVQTMPELPQMASCDGSSGTIIDSALHSAFSAIAKCAVAIDDRAKHPVRLGQGSIGAALTMPELPIMNFKLEDSSSGAASGLQDDSKNMRSGVDLDHKSRKVPGNDVPVVQERAERDAAQDVTNHGVTSEGKHCFHSHVRISGQSKVASGVQTMPELPQMASFEDSSGAIIDSALHSEFSAIAKCAGAVDDQAKHPVRLGQVSIGAALTMPALPIMNFKLEDSSSGTAPGLQDDSKHMRSGVDLDHKSRKLPGDDVPVVQERAERDAAQDVVGSMDLLCLAKKIGLVSSTDMRSHCSKSWQRPPGAATTMPELPTMT